MSRMPLQLMLIASLAPGLTAVSGCADSAAGDAVQIETVQEIFPSATDISTISTDRDVQVSGRPGTPVVSEIRDSSGLLGYSVVSEVAGRSGPFKIHVVLDTRGVVRGATVISYPWSRGRDVRKRSFTSQFEGKGPEDAIEISKDIDAVAGATISCRAVAQGVREAVKLIAG
jgi:Na+-translocating ferredoxin:NAD+ oxidoreductase RnfG subunit